MKWVVLFAMVLLAACSGEPPPASPEVSAQADAPRRQRKVSVRVEPVLRRDIQKTLRLTGVAELWDQFSVSSEIAGKAVAIHVDEGDWVEKGQPLIELDRKRRQLLLKTREAELAKAEVELAYARKQLRRGQTLLERGAISREELDGLEQAVKLAASAAELAQLSIQVIEDELEDTSINAPVGGQVSERLVSLGENVTPALPLLELIQYDPIKVVTEIPEVDLFHVGPGDRVEMAFDALPGRSFSGRISRIAPEANPRSGAFEAEVRVANPQHLLKAGMVARLRIPGETHRRALVAPLDAILESEGSHYVFVVEEGTARRRGLRVVDRIGDFAVVEGDLQAGQRVATTGNVNLTDGAPVKLTTP